MPKALEADKAVIQCMIHDGWTCGQIARKTGLNPKTVQTWAKRHGWREAAQKSAMLLQQTRMPALAAQVAKASGVLRQTIAEELVDQATRLRTLPHGKGIDAARKRADVVKTLADASEKTCQWSQQSATQLVQVETLLDLEHRPTVRVLPGSNDTQAASIAPTQDVGMFAESNRKRIGRVSAMAQAWAGGT